MRKNKNDCSVIAGRQGDTSVVCSWLEDAGSTICEVGRYLEQYQTAEKVKCIFQPQKEAGNGKNKCAKSGFLPVNQESWIMKSEDNIFDSFSVQHCFLYEWDQNWYYIFRGPGDLLFKLPLQLIMHNTGGISEGDYLHKVQIDVLTAIFRQRVRVDPCLRLYLVIYVGEYEDLLQEIRDSRDHEELGLIYQRLTRAYESCGRWIVIESDANCNKISRIITVDEHKGAHIETCLW